LTLHKTALFFALFASAHADTLMLVNGPPVSGNYIGIDPGQITFQVNGQVKTYRRSDVLEVILSGRRISENSERPTILMSKNSERPTILPGQTIDEVEALLGKPAELYDLGTKKIYVYEDPVLKITFRDGKVADSPTPARPPVVPAPDANQPVMARVPEAAPAPSNLPPPPPRPKPSEPATISSVTFDGSAADPIIRIAGRGFDPIRPAATGPGYPGYNGMDYGTELHIEVSGRASFDAGYDDPSAGRHDAIGLVLGTYSGSEITLMLGSNYAGYYYPKTFRMDEGDKFTVYIRRAAYSGTVHYPTAPRVPEKIVPARDTAIRDTAIITNSNGTSAQAANPVPTPGGPGTMGPDGVYRLGSGVSQPTRLSGEGIVPPELAVELGVHGEVDVSLVVQPDGTVRDLKLVHQIGYGLDEKAIEAARKWRFKPGLKDGNPVPVPIQIGFVVSPPDPRSPGMWSSGPMVFALEAGLTPPVVKDGTMPKPGQQDLNESVVLEFTVDSKGLVKNIHPVSGTQPASDLLSRSLATWKFWPGMKGQQPTEATGSVRFFNGQRDEAANFPLSPPPLVRSNQPEPSQAPEKTAPPVGVSQVRTVVNPKDGQRYIWIPPGAFTMGCSPGDTECDNNEKPPHEVRIANGFWLGQTEVTQAAYVRVTGGNPSAHKGDQLPVESLTWNHSTNYCTAIGGRLPKEAEWEYAARAGTEWARYGTLDTVAWHSGNSGRVTHPVAVKQPNAFGLFDMLGNVWEWVEDPYANTPSKILRGGSSGHSVDDARASRRWVSEPGIFGPYRGFRCAGDWPLDENNAPPVAADRTPTISALVAESHDPKVNSDTSDAPRKLNLLALYRLRSDGADATGVSGPFSLFNTSFRDGSLYLNGVYEHSKDKNGYRAVAPVPRLNYLHFTAALDFKAETFNGLKIVILYGGTASRFWGLGWKGGVLELTLNNGNFRHSFEEAALSQGIWHNVICSVDLSAGVIRTVLDGRALPNVQLPQGFRLEVIGSEVEGTDKNFTFANYGIGTVFQGYVNNLRIYGDSLSAAELQTLYQSIANQKPDLVHAVSPPGEGQRDPTMNAKDGLRYLWIPPGTFTMGCSVGDAACYDDEKPAHEVTFAAGFRMGQTPVTQEAWQRVVGTNPSHFKGAKLPVDSVTWKEANNYCLAVGMRLPTEAEWEYAARAGTTGSRYGDPDRTAWSLDNSGGHPHEVMQKQPNAWGLFDMLGDVWQWTADWSTRDYSANAPAVTSRVLRGGFYGLGSEFIRVSYRSRAGQDYRGMNYGFRCAGN
jgi:TonB family protein